MKASKREASLETRSRLRAVEDHHVDRPGVEVQQCMKLTGTNSSIGLTLSQLPKANWPKANGKQDHPPAQR